MKPYHVRKWLNKKDVFADSTITAFHGKHAYHNDELDKLVYYTETQLKIKDCHHSIRFHVVKDDGEAFIKN